MTAGEYLRHWRAKHSLSQAQAAAWLDVSVFTLQGWEQGRTVRHPRIVMMALNHLDDVWKRRSWMPSEVVPEGRDEKAT